MVGMFLVTSRAVVAVVNTVMELVQLSLLEVKLSPLVTMIRCKRNHPVGKFYIIPRPCPPVKYCTVSYTKIAPLPMKHGTGTVPYVP